MTDLQSQIKQFQNQDLRIIVVLRKRGPATVSIKSLKVDSGENLLYAQNEIDRIMLMFGYSQKSPNWIKTAQGIAYREYDKQ